MLTHLKDSYGLLTGVWLGIFSTLAATMLIRVIAPLSLAFFLTSAEWGLSGNQWLLLFLGCYAAGVFLHYAADFVFVSTTDRRYEYLVGQLFSRMYGLQHSFHRETMSGTLNSVFRDYMDGTINVFRLLRTDIGPMALTFLFSSIILFYYDTLAVFFFICAIGLQATISVRAINATKPARAATKKIYRELSGVFNNYLENITTVIVSQRLDFFLNRVKSLANQEGSLFWRRHKITFQYELYANALTAFCFGGVIFALGRAELTPQEFYQSTFVAALFSFQGMLLAQSMGDLAQRFAEHWNNARSAIVLLNRNEYAAVKKRHSAHSAVSFSEVSVSNLRFAYDESDDSNDIFDDVNFFLRSGDHVIVRGDNAAGKTTLFSLLLRFDTPLQGTIAYGGVDLGEISDQVLFSGVSYVEQGAPLIVGTIRDNLFLFNEGVSEARAKDVMQICGLDTALQVGELSLDQHVGEAGSFLSGGQRQRIAIARGLMRDCDIYLFDEPTSALPDKESAALINSVLSFLEGKTVIMISHSEEHEELFQRVLHVRDGNVRLVDRFS